ncbi:MAG: class I SAM-dependent methyltransferase [Candidatus Glassbacteria bacterium]
MKNETAKHPAGETSRIKRRRYAEQEFGASYDERYESGLNRINTEVEREWVAGRITGGPVLDAGAGTGRLAAWLAGRNVPVTALDSSLNMLTHLRGKIRDLPAAAGDLYRLPFPDGCFGSVVCLHVLFHLPDWPIVVAELARVLKPGGRLIFEMRSGEHVRLAGRVLQLFGSGLQETGPVDPAAATIHVTRAQVRRVLAGTGLRLEKTFAYDLVHSYWFRPLAGLTQRILSFSPLVRRFWRAVELGPARLLSPWLLYRTLYVCRKNDLSG